MLKRVVIKEELVAITGDYLKAIILQQFLYWTDRVKDIDSFLRQENKRLEGKIFSELDLLSAGWIYKTATELSEETMLYLSAPTIRKNIKALIQKGYLYQRKNPKYRWDKTMQYRIDLNKINNDLEEKGYHLEGFKNFGVIKERIGTNIENKQAKNFSLEENRDNANKLMQKQKEILNTIAQNNKDFSSNEKFFPSNENALQAIPENTTYNNSLKKESELSLTNLSTKKEALSTEKSTTKDDLSTMLKELTKALLLIANKLMPKKTNVLSKEKNTKEISSSPNLDTAKRILAHLNQKLDTHYVLDNNTFKLINARLEENYVFENFVTVIDKKCKAWMNTPFAPNLKPKTLFSEKHFNEYLNEPEAVYCSQNNKSKNKRKEYEFEKNAHWDFDLIERLATQD